MPATETSSPNGQASLELQRDRGSLTWSWPLMLVWARLVLAFVVQAMVAGLYAVAGHTSPWAGAGPWWIVSGSLIDLGCLALMAQASRREGLRLGDLLNLAGQGPGRVGASSVGLLVAMFVLFLVGGVLAGPAFYGADTPRTPCGALPLWGAVYSCTVWPVLWGLTEQLTYLGSPLPRLQVLSGRSWVAVALVCLGWCAQHLALPFIMAGQWLAYRFVSVVPIATVLPLNYPRTRRLVPLIIAHATIDAAGTLTFVLLPALS